MGETKRTSPQEVKRKPVVHRAHGGVSMLGFTLKPATKLVSPRFRDAEALSPETEAHARCGRNLLRGCRSGHEVVHGTMAEKEARWEAWRKEYERIHGVNPSLSPTGICKLIAQDSTNKKGKPYCTRTVYEKLKDMGVIQKKE